MTLEQQIELAMDFVEIKSPIRIFSDDPNCNYHVEVTLEARREPWLCVVVTVYNRNSEVILECGDILDEGYHDDLVENGIDLQSEGWAIYEDDLKAVEETIHGISERLEKMKGESNG